MNAPRTDEGRAAWAVLERCAGQLRASFGAPFGLDFAAVLAFAEAAGCRNDLLVEVLPAVEAVLIAAMQQKD